MTKQFLAKESPLEVRKCFFENPKASKTMSTELRLSRIRLLDRKIQVALPNNHSASLVGYPSGWYTGDNRVNVCTLHQCSEKHVTA